MRDVIIQPIYVIDTNRRSVPYELKAMDTIVKLLESKEKTRAKFLPAKMINIADIPENPEITAAYQVFKEEADMGSQHDWLARLAKEYPGMECCIEKALGEHAPIRQSIQRHGRLIDTGDGYIVDKENCSHELALVLGNLKLPIFEKTEMDMLKDIQRWGYEDVMQEIWFCHNPINGKPCGFCSPCSTKMTSNMAVLLTADARKRYKRMKLIEKTFGGKAASIYKRAARKYGKIKGRLL